MFEKRDIIKIISLGIIVLLLIIFTIILTNNKEQTQNNKINETINNSIENNINNEETQIIEYVEYKVNYNLTPEERDIMQKQAEQREMEGGFDDSKM